jgi:hypothetical protein
MVRSLCACRIQARLKVDAEEMAKWRWGVRASSMAEPEEIKELDISVLGEIKRIAGHQKSANPPYVCMVHEMKGHGVRAPSRTTFGHHEGINIS